MFTKILYRPALAMVISILLLFLGVRNLNRNFFFCLAFVLIFLLLFYVPQISSLWTELPFRMLRENPPWTLTF